jgi:hypothetical protein
VHTYVRTNLCMHACGIFARFAMFSGELRGTYNAYVCDGYREMNKSVHSVQWFSSSSPMDPRGHRLGHGRWAPHHGPNGFIGRARTGQSQQQVGCSRLHRLAET